MSARVGSVLAGVVVPPQIPQAIGIGGWARVMGERIQADGYIVLQYKHNAKVLLEAAVQLQQRTKKPAYVRLTVGQMHADLLQRVLEAASERKIAGIFMSQGCEGEGDPMRLSIKNALAIFTRIHGSSSEKPLVACPVPLPRLNRSQDEAYRQLEERVASGVDQLIMPPWQDPLSAVCYLEGFKEPLPEVIQTICTIGQKKAWDEIRLHEPITPSQQAHRTLKREAGAAKAFRSLTSEKVPLAGIYVNLCQSDDDNFERIIDKVNKLSLTGAKT